MARTKDARTFIMYKDYISAFELLPYESVGRILMAAYAYTFGENEVELSDSEKLVFAFIKNSIDRDMERYEEVCRNKSEAAKKRCKKQAENCAEQADEEKNETSDANPEDEASDDAVTDVTTVTDSTDVTAVGKNKNKNKNNNKSYLKNKNKGCTPLYSEDAPSFDIALMFENARKNMRT